MINYAIAFSKINGKYNKIRLLQFEKDTILQKSNIVDINFSDLDKYKIENIKRKGNDIISYNGAVYRYHNEENGKVIRDSIVILYKCEDGFIICNSEGNIAKFSTNTIIANKWKIANGKIVDNKFISAIEGEYEVFESQIKFKTLTEKHYILKHKNINVLEFLFDTDYRLRIVKILNKEHLPYPLIYTLNEYKFFIWFQDRLIPANRYQYDRFVKALDLYDTNNKLQMIIDNKALSLSDCYWVCEKDSNDTWEKVNYFSNDFNIQLLDFYLASPLSTYKNHIPVIINPAMGLTGYLPKAWTIINKERVLLKRGTERNIQVYNEVCVSKIAKDCEIKALEYTKTNYKDYECSACRCFCSEQLELVSAMDLTQNINDKEPLGIQIENYKNLVKKYIPNIDQYIDQMLILDYITANEDRHWGNFGILRNPDTLKIIDIAPLYDFGNSLWYNFFPECIGNENTNKIAENIKASQTLKFIKNKNAIDLDKLEKALDVIKVIFAKTGEGELIYNACIKRLNIIRNL